MKATLFLALALIVSASLSCGHRTVSTSTSQSQLQAVEVNRLTVNDSVALTRRLNAIIRQPKMIVLRCGGVEDTTLVIISADEIIVGDSLAMRSNTVVAASDSAGTAMSDSEETHSTPSGPSRPWAWMFALFGALAALIALSLRGTGSHR